MSLTLPEPPRERPRAPFPIVAVIAPLIAAIVIGAIIRSPYVLVFAALSPIIAIASSVESRRTARRDARRDLEHFDRECAAFEDHLARAHEEESAEAFVAVAKSDALVIGTAPGPSHVLRDTSLSAYDDAVIRDRLARLREQAAQNPRMPVTIPRAPTRVTGSGIVAERIRARCLAECGAPAGAESVVTTVHVSQLAELTVEGADGSRWRADAVLPFAAEVRHRDAQRALIEPPPRCAFHELPETGGTGLPVGMSADGVTALDLVNDGPHILVGGASGSGKSEFLRALALSAALRVDEWSVLFVDFKGGATFLDLRGLPASVGLITDLDAALATRALGSLQAEIRRREARLAAAGVRDVAHAAGQLRRLLVIVDEYAALVQHHPELHAVFADLSARGRSLGMHLVLCTQRPAGVVNDQVSVNCGIRVLFRTADAADARALVGRSSSEVERAPRGRAFIARDGHVAPVQVALVAETDIARVTERTASRVESREQTAPWAEPLPVAITAGDPRIHWQEGSRDDGTPRGATQFVFGVSDDVAHQRWTPAAWIPERDGVLGISGSSGSGRSTALSAVAISARRAGWLVVRLPNRLADAVGALSVIAKRAQEGRRLLVIADDLGDMLSAAPHDHVSVLLARLDEAIRALHLHAGALALDLGVASASTRWAAGRVGVRLALRALDGDDHLVAGAPRGSFDRRTPAGRGWWNALAVQVFTPETTGPELWRGEPSEVPVLSPHEIDGPIAVIATQPERAARLLARPPRARVPELLPAAAGSAGPVTPETAIVGHPDEWQRAWAALAERRRDAHLVVDGVDIADVRALLGARVDAPPLEAGEVWIVEPGQGSSPRLLRGRWAEAPEV